MENELIYVFQRPNNESCQTFSLHSAVFRILLGHKNPAKINDHAVILENVLKHKISVNKETCPPRAQILHCISLYTCIIYLLAA